VLGGHALVTGTRGLGRRAPNYADGMSFGDALSAGQLGKKAWDKAFKSDPIWNLKRLVRVAVGRRHEVSLHRDAVLKRIDGLWLDPALIGHLQTLLTTGDTAEFVPLRKTLERLLVFGDDQLETAIVVQVVFEAIRDNLSGAAQDAREGRTSMNYSPVAKREVGSGASKDR
jgi:hypothetical protein